MFAMNWDPAAELQRLRAEVDRLFGRYGTSSRPGEPADFPPINSRQEEQHIYLEAELPGFREDDLEIYVSGGKLLSLRGHRTAPEHHGGHWRRRERSHGRFARSIELPTTVDTNDVQANLERGVLTIRLRKQSETPTRKIPVQGD